MKKVFRNCINRIMACMLILALLTGCGNSYKMEKTEDTSMVDGIVGSNAIYPETAASGEKISNINLWYTNDELTQYLADCAIRFREENEIGVNLNLVSSVDYIEAIYQSTKEGNVADVYIINTESLEKAYLAGIASENTEVVYNDYNYPDIALNASTYHGKLIAYPFYYDTTFFMYNKDYVEAPETFSDIVGFSESYMGEYENIETILQWDVHNLFFSYGFVGAYLNFGGECGDDSSLIDIANDKVIEALTSFKQINQSLYFDANDSKNENVLEKFLAGKILYTIGSTANLEEIIVSDINYGICTLPAIDDDTETKAVSINYAAVVNPYSTNKEMARKLAQRITFEHAEEFYSYVGKLPSRRLDEYPNEEWKHIAEQYEHTATFPKLMAATNYWLELEVTLNGIWDKELDEETTIAGIDETLSEEEERRIRQEYTKNIIREFVTEEINKLQVLMEQQIN